MREPLRLSARGVWSYAVAIVLLWLFLRNAEWRALADALRSVGWLLIGTAILARLASLVVSSVRWQILLVPVYLLLHKLGWLDTPLALIVPAGAGAFGFFLLHQFFLGIPKDLEEAAALDGCSRWGTFRNVVLPLSKPALATLGIFTFVGSWNDFLGPLVFLDSVDKYTLPVGIALFQTSYSSEYALTLSASVLCTLPVIVVFLLFQKHIIEGIALSGLKD